MWSSLLLPHALWVQWWHFCNIQHLQSTVVGYEASPSCRLWTRWKPQAGTDKAWTQGRVKLSAPASPSEPGACALDPDHAHWPAERTVGGWPLWHSFSSLCDNHHLSFSLALIAWQHALTLVVGTSSLLQNLREVRSLILDHFQSPTLSTQLAFMSPFERLLIVDFFYVKKKKAVKLQQPAIKFHIWTKWPAENFPSADSIVFVFWFLE